jgi:nucleotide-binding universal stress UspA family protein
MQRVGKTDGEVAGVHARIGRPDAEIVGLADELGAGLIVLGSRGLGPLRRALMGSVSDSVVRHAHCGVLIVRE